jgi:bacterioferritin-associated ferredoxin
MYVCLCKGITDSQIRDAVYDGAGSFRDVRQSLGIATQCGKCACWAKDLVNETVAEINGYQSSLAYAVA